MLDGAAFMIENYCAPDGKPGYVSVLAPDNAVANPLRDTYDHMFVLLALTWASKVSGDAQIRAHLDDALAFVEGHLTTADGSFIEGIPESQPRRKTRTCTLSRRCWRCTKPLPIGKRCRARNGCWR